MKQQDKQKHVCKKRFRFWKEKLRQIMRTNQRQWLDWEFKVFNIEEPWTLIQKRKLYLEFADKARKKLKVTTQDFQSKTTLKIVVVLKRENSKKKKKKVWIYLVMEEKNNNVKPCKRYLNT